MYPTDTQTDRPHTYHATTAEMTYQATSNDMHSDVAYQQQERRGVYLYSLFRYATRLTGQNVPNVSD